MHCAMVNGLTSETSAEARQPAVRIAPFGTVSVQIVMAGGPARAETEPRTRITRLPDTTLQTVMLQVPVPRSFT
jgi:hypothetical protein